MDGEILVTGLSFPEGPVAVGNDIYFVEYEGGRVCCWNERDGVREVANTGGRPNGAALGPDGTLYVTQSGGNGARPGVLQVNPDGGFVTVADAVDGLALASPCDLAFGPDGRLWFTDPNGSPDQATYKGPGWLFALDVANGQGELVLEVGDGFANGLGFDAEGSLVWAESFSRRIRKLADGKVTDVITLPEKHLPDGVCWDENGRLYVATTYSHSVTVIESGEIVESYRCEGGAPTNCCFAGRALITTDARRGALWRHQLTVRGLSLA
jgi:gluconolactonase